MSLSQRDSLDHLIELPHFHHMTVLTFNNIISNYFHCLHLSSPPKCTFLKNLCPLHWCTPGFWNNIQHVAHNHKYWRNKERMLMRVFETEWTGNKRVFKLGWKGPLDSVMRLSMLISFTGTLVSTCVLKMLGIDPGPAAGELTVSWGQQSYNYWCNKCAKVEGTAGADNSGTDLWESGDWMRELGPGARLFWAEEWVEDEYTCPHVQQL